MQSHKTKKADIPAKPNPYEKMILDAHFEMTEYWFNALIRNKCRYVGSHIVHSEMVKDDLIHRKAQIFSVDAEMPKKGVEGENENCVYCFFIFFENKVWKADHLGGVPYLLNLMEQEQKWNEYSHKLLLDRIRNEELLEKKKAKSKVKSFDKRKKVA